MQLQLAADKFLPLAQFARLAVGYANLRTVGFDELGEFWASFRGAPRRHPVVDSWSQLQMRAVTSDGKRSAVTLPDDRKARDPKRHEWVRFLVNAAGNDETLKQKDLEKIHAVIREVRPLFDLSYQVPRKGKQKGEGLDLKIQLLDVDLYWFICMGCAALFDSGLPFRAALKQCANFAGKVDAKRPSVACGNFVIALSGGGRPNSRFCSDECRNRVGARETYKKEKLADSTAKALVAEPLELTRFSGHPTVRFGGVQDGKQDDNPVHAGV